MHCLHSRPCVHSPQGAATQTRPLREMRLRLNRERIGHLFRMWNTNMTARWARNLSGIMAIFFAGIMMASMFFGLQFWGHGVHVSLGIGAIFLSLYRGPEFWILEEIRYRWSDPHYWKLSLLPRIQSGARGGVVAIPLWIPTALAVIVFVYFYRKARHKPGHCRKCEYNLTGNESGVCPECGTKFA